MKIDCISQGRVKEMAKKIAQQLDSYLYDEIKRLQNKINELEDNIRFLNNKVLQM